MRAVRSSTFTFRSSSRLLCWRRGRVRKGLAPPPPPPPPRRGHQLDKLVQGAFHGPAILMFPPHRHQHHPLHQLLPCVYVNSPVLYVNSSTFPGGRCPLPGPGRGG